MKKHVVVFDFDNTITAFDVLDDMLLRFSINKKWEELERRWKAAKIGSRICLKGQMKGIRIDKKTLDRYLAAVRIDPYFKRLVGLLRSKNIKMAVLSDNFEYILKKILKDKGIPDLKLYSNRLTIAGDRLIPSFPFTNRKCRSCGHCKKKNLAGIDKGDSVVYYIGDGMSDICPSKNADVIFAKANLKEHLKKEHVPHISINGLKDVYKYFERILV